MAGTGDANRASIKSDRSTVDNRNASYRDIRDVYNAPVVHQTVVRKTVVRKEKGVTYGIDKEDVGGLESWSLLLMKVLGERNTIVGTAAFFLLGSGSFLSGVYGKPAFVAPYSTGMMMAGFLMLFVGASLYAGVQYRYKSRCVKCNTFYAMKEVGNPKAREVKARGGVRRTTMRTYRCKECGHEVNEEENEFIEDEPEE